MIKVLLVESQTLLREGLHALLKASDELEVVGAAANGREAIRLAKKLNPDVILMGAAVPDMTSVEAARQIRSAQPHIRILILSADVSRQEVFECLQAGAAGVVHTNSSTTELLSGIHKVLSSGTYLSPELANLVVGGYFRKAQDQREVNEMDVLTEREVEVLRLMVEGNASNKIAQTLNISARTVETHRRNIMEKLNVHSVAGLTKFAIRHGLTSL
jgi:DNA-binding NarL/FixJ family response regulator